MSVAIWRTALTKSFKTAYPNARWAWASLLATSTLAPIVICFGFQRLPEDPDPLHFLLGAQAETLGTIFVLAFTFSVVVAQVATRYHWVLFDRILGGWAMWYAVPFGVGIILPLFLLHGHFFLWATRISLLIGAYCILSLIPFTVAVRKLLSISAALDDKRQEVLAATSHPEIERSINDLSGITVGALFVNDFNAFETGVEKFVDLANCKDSAQHLAPMVSNEVLELIRRNAGNRFASAILMDAMVKIGLRCAPEGEAGDSVQILEHLAQAYEATDITTLRSHAQAIRSIAGYACAAIADHRTDAVIQFQNILYTISERSIAELPASTETGREAVEIMGEIIQYALTSTLALADQDRLVNHAIAQIEAIGTKANAVGQTRVAGAAQVQLLRATRNNSENGQRIRGRLEASLAAIGSIQHFEPAIPIPPVR